MNDMLITLFGLLSVLCLIFVIGIFAFAIWNRGQQQRLDGNMLVDIYEQLSAFALPLAFFVSLVSVAGSLYLSEIKHYEPCLLCWMQRVLIYPQLLLSAYLLIRPRSWIALGGGITFALFCLPLSIYNYLIEWFPSIETSACVATGPSCTVVYVKEFGFITIPLMAFIVSLTLFALYALSLRRSHPCTELKEVSHG